ncbi:glycosyltransferase family 2 protein [Calothrix sp. PCC 7507]|uniref:glycosyltransferase family 2 protein n=1 Tax=Calothrix sp. PCC 7507 TaxID=99598 RepID=UPI00029F070D|nr:glycosyltransferase family 2 protein [Calothrix sp. PCC 7507]AFY35653.1 glycosyl transferase family 2 [Calothrix sp. PCC 7507]
MSIYQVLILCIDALLIIGALGVLVLCLMLLLECIAALLPVPAQASNDRRQDPKVAVLVPAHNEELVIRTTLNDLIPELTSQHRLVVIADNCSDATAEIARAAGATVLERHNLDLKGKGYALEYGLQYLESEPPDVVVLMDADCKVHPGAIAQLTQQAIATKRPIQGVYLMEKPESPTPKDAVSAFAFKVKNLVRSSGLARMGLPCFLDGTGMAFPWSVIRSVDIANGNIVEDMKLGLDLNIAGHRPMFCPQANVTGYLPQQSQAATSQRTRWEHGHLQTLITYVPRLLQASLQQKRFDLFISALDLCIPPLSLLVLLWSALMTAAVLCGFWGASWIPTTLLAGAGAFLLTAIFAAWIKYGRTDIPLLQLLSIPIYILWKIPLYLKFLVKPQKNWVRTERN